MAIRLEREVKRRAVQALRRYCEEKMDQAVGDLEAEFLLDFVVRRVGPVIYNRAIADAQVHLRDRLADLDGDLHEPEEDA